VAKPKVVLDSNVLISGLLWIGLPHKILKLAENKSLTIYSSLPIIEEVSRVLIRQKFAERIDELKTTSEELIESLLSIVEIVHPLVSINELKSDSEDNKVLECAVEAGADYIVSGDPHLLRLKVFKGIAMVTPREFLVREKQI
jgi:putative PIN family toxin of toxin-antitoxin system